MRLNWLADELRAAGLRVVEVAGWQQRGWEPYNPRGLVCHHTAGRCNAGSLGIVTNGRSGLPGPLAQLLLACDGTYYVVASGRANHAGKGGWRGLVGNSSVVGIEAEHPGSRSVPWPPAQLDAYYRGCAVIAKRLGFGPDMVCAHKEWAPTRKVDPIALDMGAFRNRVAEAMRGKAPVPQPPEEEDLDMKAYVLFNPVFPGANPHGQLKAGGGHWYMGLPNGTSVWLSSIALKNALASRGASNHGDVGADHFLLWWPVDGPHYPEYGTMKRSWT